MTEKQRRRLLYGLAALVPGLLLLGAPGYGQQAEIPEHPKPGKALPPGFVAPDPPFEERIIWDDEKPEEADFIPQVIFDKYSLDELPLTERQRESLESSIRMTRPLEDPPPYPWWKPMPECLWKTHSRGSDPYPSAVSYAQLILEEDVAFIGEVVAIVPGWHTTWELGTNAVYYRLVDILRDTNNSLADGQIVAHNTLRLDSEITVNGEVLCTAGLRDFRGQKVGETWLIAGDYRKDGTVFDAWLALPVEESQVLPQPIGLLKNREPIELTELKAQLEERRQ